MRKRKLAVTVQDAWFKELLKKAEHETAAT